MSAIRTIVVKTLKAARVPIDIIHRKATRKPRAAHELVLVGDVVTWQHRETGQTLAATCGIEPREPLAPSDILSWHPLNSPAL